MTKTIPMRRAWFGLVVLAVLGCDSGQAIRSDALEVAREGFDSDRAKEALVAALDAWKRGEARRLARRSPPVRFSDDDVAAGLRLIDYELIEADAPIAPFESVPVILSLRDARGRTVRRETSYQIATAPVLAVMRSDP